MITITRELLRSWGACWSNQQIAARVPEAGVTPLEVCDASEVDAKDRLWVLLREDVISARDLRLLACIWAERALDRLPVDRVDPRSLDAIAVSRRFALGEATLRELKEASAAARAAAWAASAASAAARAAAEAAERESQLAEVRRVLCGVAA